MADDPFAVNDLYFARETGIKAEDMNAYGCSLVYGHPQGPTGLRSIAELIETLRLRGGGLGLHRVRSGGHRRPARPGGHRLMITSGGPFAIPRIQT